MLSQSVGYAATALGFIAASDGRALLIKEIAEEAGLPLPYLGKLIHTLAKKQILKTQRGIGGGVTLIPRPEEVTLYEIAQIFDDPIVRKRCMLGNSECSDSRACPCHQFWVVEREKQISFLRKTTLKDMANFYKRLRSKR